MVAFFYGVPTFINDLVEITRSDAVGRAWPLFYLVYYFLTPATLAGVDSYSINADQFYRMPIENVPSQLLGMTIWDWQWRSDNDPTAYEPWADVVGSLLVSPALLLPPLAALFVLYQHRDNLTSVLKPTHLWRKNALKQNKKDKYRGEERSFRYNLRSDQLQREKKTNSVISDA